MRFHIWNTVGLIFSLTLGMSLSASAHASQNFFRTKKIHFAQSSDTFQLPRYDRFVKLPRATQNRYMKAFQAALLELDKEARSTSTGDSASLLLKYWIANAEANSSSDFCINLGVVRPVSDPVTSDCDPHQGAKMHDFDTSKDLAPLGDAATHCKGGEKPCSPAFGLDGNGNFYCSLPNLTSHCADVSSKDTHNTPLAKVLSVCAAGHKVETSDGVEIVDCTKLKKFFDDQTKLVEDHCKASPATKACGILKAQLKEVADDLATTDKPADTDELDRQAVGMADTMTKTLSAPPAAGPDCLSGTTGAKPNTPPASVPAPGSPPTLPATVAIPTLTSSTTTTALAPVATHAGSTTSPTTTAPATTTTPPASTSAACPDTPLPPGTGATFDKIFETIHKPGDPAKATCLGIVLPNQSTLKVNVDKDSDGDINIQPAAVNGKLAASISLQAEDLGICMIVSNVMKKATPAITDTNLLAAYLPAQLIADTDAGKITLPTRPGNPPGKAYDTRGWLTTDGTRIRYIPDQYFGSDKEVLIGITLKGGQEELKAFSTSDDE
jgi:hypothetical protein